MRIQLQNKYLVPLIPFLQDMKLKGEYSRARSKFLKLAAEAFTSLQESELELVKEYALLDESGNPKETGEGRFTLKEGAAQEYYAARDQLFSEVAEIEGATYITHMETMWKVLKEYTAELDGEQAELYDVLCDAFEEVMGNAGA